MRRTRSHARSTRQGGESFSPAEQTELLLALRPGAWLVSVTRAPTAFLMACIYLIFEYVRPQSIYSSLEALPLTQTVMILGLWTAVLYQAKSKQPVFGSQWKVLITYLSIAVASIIASEFPDAAIPWLLLLISWYVAIFIISSVTDTPAKFVVLYVLFLCVSLKMSQHGFRSWAAAGFGFVRTGVHGAPGWFHNSGEVGIQMCIFLPMTLYFMAAGWKHWSKIKRVVMCAVPVTIIGTILGSSSRGAVVGGAAALGFMVLQNSKYRLRILCAAILCAVVAANWLPEQAVKRFDSMGDDSTSVHRLTYWKYGLEQMTDHPILGIGLGNWIPVYGRHVASTGSDGRVQLPHNIFVQAGAELGFSGLIVIIVIIGMTFVLNARTRKLSTSTNLPHVRLFSLGLDAGMVGFLVSAQFVTVLYYPYLWIALALTIALHNSTARAVRELISARSTDALSSVGRPSNTNSSSLA